MNILILSDTHSFLDPRIEKHAVWADEIWHAGDIGDIKVMDALKKIKPVRGVYGNIDGHVVRAEYPLVNAFEINGKKIVITHIAGYPNRYKPSAMKLISKEKPDVFICGHSHILKVMYDKSLNHLHINPGAAGKHGFHVVQTLIRLVIPESGPIKKLEVVELKPE